jgi:hypothetical protein
VSRAMVSNLGAFPRPVLMALAAAERLLTRRAGASVVLADPEDLGGSDRSVVARARVARNPFSLPRTLVVKHYLADPEPGRPDPFHHEVASCQLFTALPSEARASPELIAHDPQARLLVLEDLGRSSTLADALFGPDPAAAQRCLLGWARGLGRMQATTAGRENDFGALLRRLGERSWRDPVAEDARAALAGVSAMLTDVLGVPVPDAALRDAQGSARLLGGTRYRAFSPSDTCPDNNLVTSRGVRVGSGPSRASRPRIRGSSHHVHSHTHSSCASSSRCPSSSGSSRSGHTPEISLRQASSITAVTPGGSAKLASQAGNGTRK